MNYPWIETRTATPIVELRRYRLHPGRRDALIALFERRFIEPQEAAGAHVLGTFEVEGDSDSFLWLRGFADMEARRQALADFYGGPVWRANREAANASIIDSHDVHLLRAIAPQAGLTLSGLRHPPLGATWPAQNYRLMISELRFPELVGNYHLWLRLFLRKAGSDPLASFATLPAENNYPALPVWRTRHVHVALLRAGGCLPALPAELAAMLRQPPEIVSLNPTARSLLR